MESHDLSISKDLTFKITERIPENFNLSFSASSGSRIQRLHLSIEDELIGSRTNYGNILCSPKTPKTPKTVVDRKKHVGNYKKSLKGAKLNKKEATRNELDIFHNPFQVTRIAKAYAKKISTLIKKIKLYKSFTNYKKYHFDIIGDNAASGQESKFDTQIPLKRLQTRRKTSNFVKEYAPQNHFSNELIKVKMAKALEKLDNLLPTFNPLAPLKILWDILMVLLTLSCIFIYSIEKAFLTDLGMKWLGILLMVTLYMDIIINLNTKIFDDGVQVNDRRKILHHFIRYKCLSELVPCLGISILYQSGSPEILYDLNILLLLKIPRITETAEKFKEWLIHNEKTESLYNLIILLMKIFLWGHVIACLWHYLAYISIYEPEGNNWLKMKGIQEQPWSTKYLYSIYWSFTTMLTVGYGDIAPTNRQEIFFNIWAMFLGCVMFGYSMSRIAEIVKMFDATDRQLKGQMAKVIALMRDKKLPLETQTKVRKYLEFVWKQELKEDPEHEKIIMNKLSSNLKDEIAFFTNVRYLKKVPAFSSFADKTLVKLAGAMKKVRFSPEEYVYREGEYEEICIYFVIDGNLEQLQESQSYKNQRNILWKTYTKDDYFGVQELFTGQTRPLAVISADFSTLFQLNRNDLIKILQKNPDEYEKFCKIRDLDLILQEKEQYGIKCTSCNFTDHRTHDCKFFKYSPNKLVVIGRYKNTRNKRRTKIKRKRAISKNSLFEKQEVIEALNDFTYTYQEDEDYIKLKKLYIGQNSESELKNEQESTNNINEKTVSEDLNDDTFEPISLAYLDTYQKPAGKRSLIPVRRKTEREKSTSQIEISNLNLASGKSEKVLPHEVYKTKSITQTTRTNTKLGNNHRPKNETPFDKIRSFRYYFPHNNIENIINRITSKHYINVRDRDNHLVKT